MTILEHLLLQNKNRSTQTIQKWRSAISRAENIDSPRRANLLDIYNETLLDTHLTSQINLRKQNTISKDWSIWKNNEPQTDLYNLLDSESFYNTINHILDALFFGHSLIEITIDDKSNTFFPTLIPRQHLVPEQGLLLKNINDTTGIHYKDTFKGQYIETPTIGLGVLNQVTPLVLYKRFCVAAWAEFTEMFGMPLRVGKTNVRDREAVAKMSDMMMQMGTASYAVIGEDEQIQFFEQSKANGDIYKSLVEHCNSEISKIINGAVVGEASQGGSRAKEQVGASLGSFVYAADQRMTSSIINTQLFPLLTQRGFPLQDCTFSFNISKDNKYLWDMTFQAMQYFDVDPEFIKEEFGIPVLNPKQSNNF